MPFRPLDLFRHRQNHPRDDAHLPSNPSRKLLVGTWILWGLSLAGAPTMAYLFHTLIAPDETDDFGMGPFLSGLIIGGLLAVLFGIAALGMNVALRRVRPLKRKRLLVLERLILIAPPMLVLAPVFGLGGASGLLGVLFFGFAAAVVIAWLA